MNIFFDCKIKSNIFLTKSRFGHSEHQKNLTLPSPIRRGNLYLLLIGGGGEAGGGFLEGDL